MKITAHGNKTLQWISNRYGGRMWTLFTCSLHSRVTYSFERGNETSTTMKGVNSFSI
jgi:hypothetical protein